MEFGAKTEIKIKNKQAEDSHLKMHTVGHTLSVIHPQDIFCHIKRLAASVDLKTSHHFLLRFFKKMKWVLMKGSHFVICIGMRSPFQTSPKLGCGWKLHSVLSFGGFFSCHTPTLCLSSLILWSSHNSTLCHSCLMCREWIKQSVIST